RRAGRSRAGARDALPGRRRHVGHLGVRVSAPAGWGAARAAARGGHAAVRAALAAAAAWGRLLLVAGSPLAWALAHDVLSLAAVRRAPAVPAYAAGWTLMVGAMMLPGALALATPTRLSGWLAGYLGAMAAAGALLTALRVGAAREGRAGPARPPRGRVGAVPPRSGRAVGRRERHAHRGAAVAAELEIDVVGRGHRPHDAQPQALGDLGGEARPRVGHLQEGSPVPRARQDRDAAEARGLDRVVEEVVERLGQQARVRAGDGGRRADLEPDALRDGERQEAVVGGSGQVGEVDGVDVQLGRLGPRQRQEVLGQRLEPDRLVVEAADRLGRDRAAAVGGVEAGPEGGEGRAQLVGRVLEEAALPQALLLE